MTDTDIAPRFRGTAKTLARRIRHHMLIRLIEASQALADEDTLVADILGLARRAIEK